MSGDKIKLGCRVLLVAVWIIVTATILQAANKGVTEQQIGPFFVEADFDLSEMSSELAVLETLYAEIVQALNLPSAREGIRVRIFKDENAWRRYWRQKFSDTPYRRGMFVRKDLILDRSGYKAYVYLCRNPKFDADLRHECTHAILSATINRSIPIWLDEGLAEYYEVPLTERVSNPAWLERTRVRLRSGQLTKLDRLEKLAGMIDMTNDRYGDSWAWVCYLLNGPVSIRSFLPEYLADYAARRPFMTPISRRAKSNPAASYQALGQFFLSK